MASEKQIEANRLNASKSTGPKTPKGKATAAKNSIKHGIFTLQNTIPGESQADFDLHRDRLFEQFGPADSLETFLTERIVTLSWRLQRAGRVQTAVVNSLCDSHRNRHLGPLAGLGARFAPKSDSPPPPDHEIGNITIKDFANSKVLDNLMMQERRIESSLFKTITELQRKQMIRKIDAEKRQKS